MEKVFVPERNVTISTVVPLSLKNRLLMEASKLGISLSEFLFHLIENSGCNAFSANEIQQKNIEIQNLQNQITELETKLQELENEQNDQQDESQRAESLEQFTEKFNVAYCDLKRFAFKAFAEQQIFNYANNEINEYIRENVSPELETMKKQGLQNVLELFVSKLKNPHKIDKQKLLADIETEFDKACQMQEVLALFYLTAKDKQVIFFNNQKDIINDFTQKIDDIEMGLREKDKDLFISCEIEWEYPTEDLQSEFEQDLKAEVATYELLQETEQAPEPKTEVKALPTAEPKTEVKTSTTAKPNLQYVPKSKEEAILHELYQDGVRYITRPELKALGFNTGFWGKLTVRGARYGNYKLEKNFSDKVFKLVKLA